jgi:hypothetical protein
VRKKAKRKLRRGDQIRILRPGGYYHHGIYIGYGEVIHFWDERLKSDSTVRRGKLAEFGPLDEIEVVRYSEASTLPRETTVLIAIKLLGSKGYHLTQNNCEHLATYCKTGRRESIQLQVVRLTVRFLRVADGDGKWRVVRVLDRYLAKKKTPEEMSRLEFPKLPARTIRKVELQRKVDKARELIAREERRRPSKGINAAIVKAADALKKSGVLAKWIPALLGTAPGRVADARANQRKKSP